jgi:hypothetical protein
MSTFTIDENAPIPVEFAPAPGVKSAIRCVVRHLRIIFSAI